MPPLDESTTWIAVGFAIGAGAIAFALSIVLIVLLARARKAPAGELEEMLKESTERTEAMVADLKHALERAREESKRRRQLARIGSTIDLDAVLARTLEAAGAQPGVDAVMIVLPEREGGAGEPLIATLGMSAEEAVRQPVAGPADGREARAVTFTYRYAAEQDGVPGELIRGGLLVPLRSEEDEAVGTLAVFWRGAEREPSEEELDLLEELAASSGPAIENARKFREARQLADLDALTNLRNRRYFHDTLGREAARAHRYDRRLALIVFDIDDFKAINDRAGHLAGDAVLAEVAARVQSVMRSADIACRAGGDEFAVILPESTLQDAEQLYRRLQLTVAARPVGPAERLYLSGGIAELKPEDDGTSFFERADEALYRAKEAGKGQMIAADNRA